MVGVSLVCTAVLPSGCTGPTGENAVPKAASASVSITIADRNADGRPDCVVAELTVRDSQLSPLDLPGHVILLLNERKFDSEDTKGEEIARVETDVKPANYIHDSLEFRLPYPQLQPGQRRIATLEVRFIQQGEEDVVASADYIDLALLKVLPTMP